MKLLHLLPIALLSLLVSGLKAADEQDILLRGILNMGSSQAFSIGNSAGTESAWLKIGQSFSGYKLKSFDSEQKVLTVESDGKELKLSMTAASENNTAGSDEERLAEATRMINMMNFEEMMDITLDAQMDAMTDMMRQQMLKAGKDVDEEFIAFQNQAMAEMFDEIDWKPIKEGMTQVYADVFTKKELEGMSNFYTSPSGQASLEKMPQVQQKTMQVMMPAMMDASVNLQKKIKGYFKEKRKQQKAAAAQ